MLIPRSPSQFNFFIVSREAISSVPSRVLKIYIFVKHSTILQYININNIHIFITLNKCMGCKGEASTSQPLQMSTSPARGAPCRWTDEALATDEWRYNHSK